MKKSNEHRSHAQALRTDIIAAPDVWLPRREVILDWLNGFVRRTETAGFALGETEADDLTALDHFLRKKKVPVVQP